MTTQLYPDTIVQDYLRVLDRQELGSVSLLAFGAIPRLFRAARFANFLFQRKEIYASLSALC